MKLTLGIAGMFFPVMMRVFMVIAAAVRLKYDGWSDMNDTRDNKINHA